MELRASPWRLGLGLASSGVLLVVAGVASLRAAGPGSITVALLVAVFVAGLAVDYPVAARLGPDGIERRSLLRRHHLPWDDVLALTRLPPTVVDRVVGAARRGIVARTTSGRRVLVVDAREPLAVRPDLLAHLERWAPTVAVDLPIVAAAPRDTP